jgi:hypothetical protein
MAASTAENGGINGGNINGRNGVSRNVSFNESQ